ncbi:MAG: hypothetical protein V9G13_10730 [Marmoricola sp.]
MTLSALGVYDLNGYSTGTTYSGTFSISATGNPATSWIATFNSDRWHRDHQSWHCH